MPDAKMRAAIAAHRFGLGPKAGTVTNIAGDPQSAILAELAKPGAGLVNRADLPGSAAAFRAVSDFNAARQAKRVLVARETAAGRAPAAEPMQEAAEARRPQPPDLVQQIYLKEIGARVDAALAAEVGFVERLVWFWSNHFCISADKIRSMSGAYEREAIRPHVLGRFRDMLLAAESHPAMLFYLDNAASIGPDSTAGLNRNRGLNENLAREILELHTLGVHGGYSQTDVTAFAKVLTGWTFRNADNDPEHGGEFLFNRRMHEPGAIKVLDRNYEDHGVEQGRAVLTALASHPATARHIALKLARHFVADEPPPALTGKLERAFIDSDGDLKHLAETLVTAPESWTEARTKLKRPGEWVVSMVRAAGTGADPARFLGGQVTLGEPVWRPPSPAGHPDASSAWMGGLGQRLDIANTYAERIAGRADPMATLETALGPLASRPLHEGMGRAESRSQALALLFMSSEFQRR